MSPVFIPSGHRSMQCYVSPRPTRFVADAEPTRLRGETYPSVVSTALVLQIVEWCTGRSSSVRCGVLGYNQSYCLTRVYNILSAAGHIPYLDTVARPLGESMVDQLAYLHNYDFIWICYNVSYRYRVDSMVQYLLTGGTARLGWQADSFGWDIYNFGGPSEYWQGYEANHPITYAPACDGDDFWYGFRPTGIIFLDTDNFPASNWTGIPIVCEDPDVVNRYHLAAYSET